MTSVEGGGMLGFHGDDSAQPNGQQVWINSDRDMHVLGGASNSQWQFRADDRGVSKSPNQPCMGKCAMISSPPQSIIGLGPPS